MPTYEYICESCGARLERFQSITAPPVEHCPACGGLLRRLIGPGAGILVKGSSADWGSQRDHCDRSTPCCGRDRRCDTPPCGER
jgi:putative FmdB family regulatory protein